MKLKSVKGSKMLSPVCFLAILLSLSAFCGCQGTEMEESTETKNGSDATETTEAGAEAETQSVEEALAGLDYSGDHLECRVTESFSISADIISDSVYSNETYGLYECSLNPEVEVEDVEERLSEEQLAVSRELAALVDAWAGTSIAEGLYGDEDEVEAYYVETPGLFGARPNKETWYWNLSAASADSPFVVMYSLTMWTEYPFLGVTGYDESLVEQKAAEVAEAFSDFIFFDDYTWSCTWLNSELFDSLREFYEEYLDPDDYDILYGDFEGEEMFFVVLEPEIEHGLSLNLLSGSLKDYRYYNNVYLYLDSDYTVKAIEGHNYLMLQDEPYESVEIVSVQDALLAFYESVQSGSSVNDEITVLDVSLSYGMYYGEEDTMYLAPTWRITWCNESSARASFVSGVDGQVLS